MAGIGWSAPGNQADPALWQFDLGQRQLVPPGVAAKRSGTQYSFGAGWQPPRDGQRGFGVLHSPAGTPAPRGGINYTPATNEVHGPGMLAPVGHDNLTLMPAGGGVGMGQSEQDGPGFSGFRSSVGYGQSTADAPDDTGVEIPPDPTAGASTIAAAPPAQSSVDAFNAAANPASGTGTAPEGMVRLPDGTMQPFDPNGNVTYPPGSTLTARGTTYELDPNGRWTAVTKPPTASQQRTLQQGVNPTKITDKASPLYGWDVWTDPDTKHDMGRDPIKGTTVDLTANPPKGQGGGASGTPPVLAAIRSATSDSHVQMAMAMGALLEGGNLSGGWNAGDGGGSTGPFQINKNKGMHSDISVGDTQDPVKATQYMLPAYQAAVAQIPDDLWQQNPRDAAAKAAFLAEKPAQMYPMERVQSAWAQLQGGGSGGGGGDTPSGVPSGATNVMPDPYGTGLWWQDNAGTWHHSTDPNARLQKVTLSDGSTGFYDPVTKQTTTVPGTTPAPQLVPFGNQLFRYTPGAPTSRPAMGPENFVAPEGGGFRAEAGGKNLGQFPTEVAAQQAYNAALPTQLDVVAQQGIPWQGSQQQAQMQGLQSAMGKMLAQAQGFVQTPKGMGVGQSEQGPLENYLQYQTPQLPWWMDDMMAKRHSAAANSCKTLLQQDPTFCERFPDHPCCGRQVPPLVLKGGIPNASPDGGAQLVDQFGQPLPPSRTTSVPTAPPPQAVMPGTTLNPTPSMPSSPGYPGLNANVLTNTMPQVGVNIIPQTEPQAQSDVMGQGVLMPNSQSDIITSGLLQPSPQSDVMGQGLLIPQGGSDVQGQSYPQLQGLMGTTPQMGFGIGLGGMALPIMSGGLGGYSPPSFGGGFGFGGDPSQQGPTITNDAAALGLAIPTDPTTMLLGGPSMEMPTFDAGVASGAYTPIDTMSAPPDWSAPIDVSSLPAIGSSDYTGGTVGTDSTTSAVPDVAQEVADASQAAAAAGDYAAIYGVGQSEQPIPPVPPAAAKGTGSKFGQRSPIDGKPHLGTDVQAVEGTPVLAQTDGVVVGVDKKAMGGLRVMVRDKQGITRVYAHLLAATVKPGQHVRKGQPIGQVGQSGSGASGPNLHVEKHAPGGQPMNPAPEMGGEGNMPMSQDTVGMGQSAPPPVGGLQGPPPMPPQGPMGQKPQPGFGLMPKPSMPMPPQAPPNGMGHAPDSNQMVQELLQVLLKMYGVNASSIQPPSATPPKGSFGVGQSERVGYGQSTGGVDLSQILGLLSAPDPNGATNANYTNLLDPASYAMQQAQLLEALMNQQQQYGLAQGQLTGSYGGSPTLANLMDTAGLTGTLNGQQTLPAQLQQANIAAQQAGLTGMFNGAPTLANQQFQQGIFENQLNSALSNPWLQQLSGMAPGYGQPGGAGGSGQANWSGSFGISPNQGIGAGGSGGSGGKMQMYPGGGGPGQNKYGPGGSLVGGGQSETGYPTASTALTTTGGGGTSQSGGTSGGGSLGYTPPSVSGQQFVNEDPFSQAAYVTQQMAPTQNNIYGQSYQQVLRNIANWLGSQGITQANPITQLTAAANPRAYLGAQNIGAVFGLSPQEYQQQQSRQWATAAPGGGGGGFGWA